MIRDLGNELVHAEKEYYKKRNNIIQQAQEDTIIRMTELGIEGLYLVREGEDYSDIGVNYNIYGDVVYLYFLRISEDGKSLNFYGKEDSEFSEDVIAYLRKVVGEDCKIDPEKLFLDPKGYLESLGVSPKDFDYFNSWIEEDLYNIEYAEVIKEESWLYNAIMTMLEE